SPNGLQYHLQISTAHYRNALSSTSKAQPTSTPPTESSDLSPAPGAEDPPSNPDPPDQSNRPFVCQHPGCDKSYRQMSGLRYHRKHGHPQRIPVQLDDVPPTLARELPMKAKKMRRKDTLGMTSR
ncbi:hypothetical protein HGRIS_007506, partial [Hohenbuehelia grisea]